MKKTFRKFSGSSQKNTVCKNTVAKSYFSKVAGIYRKSHQRFSAFSFSEKLWKKVVLKISQNSQESTCGLQNFQEHLFHRTPPHDGLWLFPAVFGKPQMNTLYLTILIKYSLNANLKSIVQVYHFFLGRLVTFIGKHLCWSLFLIKLQAWHLF